jgi:hypothetical protein
MKYDYRLYRALTLLSFVFTPSQMYEELWPNRYAKGGIKKDVFSGGDDKMPTKAGDWREEAVFESQCVADEVRFY